MNSCWHKETIFRLVKAAFWIMLSNTSSCMAAGSYSLFAVCLIVFKLSSMVCKLTEVVYCSDSVLWEDLVFSYGLPGISWSLKCALYFALDRTLLTHSKTTWATGVLGTKHNFTTLLTQTYLYALVSHSAQTWLPIPRGSWDFSGLTKRIDSGLQFAANYPHSRRSSLMWMSGITQCLQQKV